MHINSSHLAFTLIELSIVLVIIGLLIGGLLVVKDLIDAAKIRSQISQVQKYSVAVNVFKLKYNLIPGDPTNATLLKFRLPSSGSSQVGNGNGYLDNSFGAANNGGIPPKGYLNGGEYITF